MLTHIHIQNYVIVDSLSLDFKSGLNVLTGETGAGKSIWVDAVGLALGDRADTNAIRQNETQCDITLCFDLSHIPSAKQWLCDQQLESDDECIIRRVIQHDGPSRSTINGRPCPLSLLREFSQHVLTTHGQHQQQALLKRDYQRSMLDRFAKNHNLLSQIVELYSQSQRIQKELDELNAKSSNRDAELNLLRYQLDELEQHAPQPNEWQTLSSQHQKLYNAKDLIQHVNQAIAVSIENESSSAITMIQQAIIELTSIKHDDKQITAIKELLNTATINLQEAGDELHHYRNALDLDPESLASIELRLSQIHDLARKHHVNPEQLSDVLIALQQKVTQLENIDSEIQILNDAKQKLMQQYQQLAEKLTASRHKAANVISKKITAYMQELGMQGGQFTIEFETLTNGIYAHGNERITFLVSTNPGQTLSPMNKVISGGELSRISLALQVITAEKEGTPTLLFDEVDVGIGGKTADIVGQLLRKLGEHTQVLCITHLPQVAALGHHHYKAIKQSTSKTTTTCIQPLSQAQRIDELARMLSGAKITEQTRAHAKEMLA